MTSLVGCNQQSNRKLRDGTFTGIADGYNGKVKVEAVFENKKIKSIEILEENESKTIADSALKDIPSYVIENQSLNVDLSTGATITSKAVIKAIGTAIETAGGNEVEWQKDCTGKHINQEVNMNTSVAIIGGGYSGILTALRLRQYGIKTTIIEKDSQLGGSLPFMDYGSQITVGSSELEQENELDKEGLLQELTSENSNPTLLRLLCDYVGKTTDWQVRDLGIAYQEVVDQNVFSANAIHQYDTSSGSLNTLLTKEVGVSGAQILKDTAVTGFVKENGKVVAVKAKSSDGNVIQVNADYFVIASGSYANYSSFDDLVFPYEGNEGNTGDLLTIASDENTAFSTIPSTTHYYMYTGLQVDATRAIDMYQAIQKSLKGGSLILNQSGLRFVAEDSNWDTLSKEISNQSKAYVVLNGSSYRTFKNSLLELMSDEEKEIMKDSTNGMDARYTYSNLKEACDSLNLDFNSFSAALASYNADVEIHVDNRYGRSSETIGTPIDEDSMIYFIPLSMYTYASEGGLKINQNLQVLDTEDKAVTNVYAIGSVCGSVFGDTIKAGALTTWAATSAYVVSERLASLFESKDTTKAIQLKTTQPIEVETAQPE